MTTIVTTTSQY